VTRHVNSLELPVVVNMLPVLRPLTLQFCHMNRQMYVVGVLY